MPSVTQPQHVPERMYTHRTVIIHTYRGGGVVRQHPHCRGRVRQLEHVL